MNQLVPTTPFGRRSLSLAMVASQIRADACPPDATAHKWHVFRDVTTAKDVLALSDRALAVLHALLSFMPETAMVAGPDLTVFPSNLQLASRAHGMAEATLRRHLASLVQAGLIIRRDSPNGKRYVRRGQGGSVEQAFGFDLTPLLARAAEIAGLAEEVRAEKRMLALLRERVSLLRRDVAKMIDVAISEGLPGNWLQLETHLVTLSQRFPRQVSAGTLRATTEQLQALAATVAKALESAVEIQNMSGNDRHNDGHYQNQKTDSLDKYEPSFQEAAGGTVGNNDERLTQTEEAHPISASAGFPLGLVLKACPDITFYTRQEKGPLVTWRDFVETAGLVRSTLGISPSAWDAAREAMGERDAAVTVAAILQRAEAINSPGGYLRGLTAKARDGKFSTGPILMSLLRAQAGAGDRQDGALRR